MPQAESTAYAPEGAGLSSENLSDGEIFEIQEYKKIVHFRDNILSGKHPTLKVPPGSNPSLEPLSLQTFLREPRTETEVKQTDGGDANGTGTGNSNGHVVSTALTRPNSGPPELNPIFLEKSEPLVIAELQIQRQRLERAIKEEVEQRRTARSSQAEPTSCLDLSDVLAKGLAMAQSIHAPTNHGENLTANVETASDSLDDSTFYSSRHETPESHLTSRIRNQSEGIQPTNPQTQPGKGPTRATKPSPKPHDDSGGTTTGIRSQPLNGIDNPSTASNSRPPFVSAVPGLNNYVQALNQSNGNVAGQSGDKGYSDTAAAQTHKPSSVPHHRNDVYLDSRPPSPLVRNHTLQPVAPQPTHPSAIRALAAASSTSHDAPIGGGRSALGTPAQVAALRTVSNIVTSPDSSSQGGKRKGKKKKRRTDRQAPEPEAAPYIKPEPRSPSPLTGPSYLRPNKRPRHDQGPSATARHEPRYVQDDGVQYITRQQREEPIPVGYARPAAHYQTLPGDVRYHSGEYYDVRQVRGEDFGPRPAQVEHSTMSYPTRATPGSRSISRVMVTDPYPAPSRQYREYRDGPRMTGHAEGDTFFAPPRLAHTRILVDAHGREYIEPFHNSPSHISATSPSRHGEHEVLYERLPARAVSRHPAPGPYEDDGVIYAPPNQAYVMPRRVATQPEYASHDYRDVWQREISTRPPQPHGGFVQVLAPSERRYIEEAYGGGQSGARPVETVRYQLPAEYGRVTSVRPEAQGATDFRASALPADGHHEVLQPYMRDYRPGHAQEPVAQRGLSVRPGDRPLNGGTQAGEEIAFIERPHGATQEIVYADDVRREVYR
ncbi:uncharacterized protein MAM_03930 [Metarhizium album ARSEF 1941]|uniref:Uncharacterized protein n=1 Tax=Metarhizium album (strain ARSEF 1941) TaxID=1081103 RepID=A0A0B2WX51_METAS|nr:uncharacterized protein MAM_03930 [Metarhizium album ARSEF 1941]KHN98169.1 hypothetical protein MAM_03930 [Metarhizium album ARSEF 1941]